MSLCLISYSLHLLLVYNCAYRSPGYTKANICISKENTNGKGNLVIFFFFFSLCGLSFGFKQKKWKTIFSFIETKNHSKWVSISVGKQILPGISTSPPCANPASRQLWGLATVAMETDLPQQDQHLGSKGVERVMVRVSDM